MIVKSVIDGFKKGLETTWMLAKIIVPVFFVVTFLQYTPILGWVAELFKPVMALFNLPGEAAIILVLGNFLNIYAAIGAIKAVDLSALEITTLSMMLSFSHSQLVETAVAKKLGISGFKVVFIRVSLAVVSGIIIGRMGILL
ncbi:nucleoside recognition domain-containing protein [Alkaliphilus hydrothermalis]|uniref:Spore maturation protein SpmB n=1 Tax=Alkaliphilus hydrothermalis TaxID=1482730 RepID=A0ABS2NT06_9FIRM|nr:nucleoside recognition domain-containing protein [Alkaliphilus hydrothermalis]MBM7615714.1 spore maturation protein SpmB [Alkaliphilus hydrothermalis]